MVKAVVSMSAAAATAKLCHSCKSPMSKVSCRPDSAFLCPLCDTKIHNANKLASIHARVLVCNVCEQAPATLTCKADSANLCVTCDHEIHSANPLANRHERVPISSSFSADTDRLHVIGKIDSTAIISKLFDDEEYDYDDDLEATKVEEAADSWILPKPDTKPSAAYHQKPIDYQLLFAGEDDVYTNVDLDFSSDPNSAAGADCVVPQQRENRLPPQTLFSMPSGCNQYPFKGMDNTVSCHNPFPVSYAQPNVTQSLSSNSSSMDAGVVPDPSTAAAIGDAAGSTAVRGGGLMEKYMRGNAVGIGVDREARVMRYREKRKNRKFEKTIRYASRKAYAEIRPRIKGRFAKRSEMKQEAAGGNGLFVSAAAEEEDGAFGIVPSLVF